MQAESEPRNNLLVTVLVRFAGAFLVMGMLLFIPAGTLAYWQAWVYLFVLMLMMTGVLIWLHQHDRALLERRMHTRESGGGHKWELLLSLVWMVLAFVVPGLDFRFGWSNVPVWLVLVADGLVAAGYIMFFLVLRENSYASRVIEIAEGQQVIDTGPYAYVRHPMYSGILILFVFTPLALGSYWAMPSGILMVYVLVTRIRREETMLTQELDGYEAYREKVRYRLLPYIW